MIVYVFNRRELRTPLATAVLLVAYSLWRSEWLGLIGLPLIYLAWCGCAPNFNLGNGCLPLVATAVVFVNWGVFRSPGLLAAAVGCGATWFVASLESAWRCRPEEWPAERGDAPDPTRDDSSGSS